MIITQGIPEIRCREKDIRMLCPAERKDKNNFTLYTLWIYIEGVEKPLACNYDSPEERDADCARISEAWQDTCRSEEEMAQRIQKIEVAHKSMQDAIQRTAVMLEEVKKRQESKARPAKKAKKPSPSPFVPPSLEEITKYITEKGYDKITRQNPEGMARRFVRYYAPEGVWRFQNGKPVRDWKKCMATWINRVDEEDEAHASGSAPVKQNQFISGVENNDYDFDQLEAELAGAPENT